MADSGNRAPRADVAVKSRDAFVLDDGPSTSGEDITIFLSYSREDDDVYGMIRPFKKLLGHFVYAKSGRRIKAFLDQDSIDWGEIWQDRLESEILGASVFIPLLSASYLDSKNCRMEFNKFQTSATALGVKELLLPVVLVEAPAIFHSNSNDDLVKEASARQWEVIEDAVLSDAGSAAWKTTMARLADRFVRSYEAAESRLASSTETSLLSSDSATAELEEQSDDEDDGPGIAELMITLNSGLDELTAGAKGMAPAIAELGSAASSSGSLGEKPNPKQVQAWSLKAARALQGPAEQISLSGEQMFGATKAVDVDMQRLRRIAVALLPATPGLAISYNQMLAPLTGLGAVAGQLNGLLDSMKPAEYLSVPLRKSLRPARRGLTRVTDSIRLIETWQPIQVS